MVFMNHEMLRKKRAVKVVDEIDIGRLNGPSDNELTRKKD